MKTHLLEAGFVDVQMNASFNFYSSPQDLNFFYNMVKNWFLSPEVLEAAAKYGAATRELYDNIRAAHERWRADPAALVGIAYGEAVAANPAS